MLFYFLLLVVTPASSDDVSKAQMLLQKQQYRKAADGFREAIDGGTEDWRAYRGLAEALRELGEFDDADETLSAGVKKHPTESRLWRLRGEILMLNADRAAAQGSVAGTLVTALYLDAVSAFESAVEQAPGDALSYLGLAKALLMSNKEEDAEEAARKEAEARDKAVGLKVRAEAAAKRAAESERRTRRHLYVSRMNLVQQAWNEANIERARELLRKSLPVKPGGDDLRTFAWHYWWRKLHRAQGGFSTGQRISYGMAFSPDFRHVVPTGIRSRLEAYDVKTGKVTYQFAGRIGKASDGRFSHDGRLFAAGGTTGAVSIWSTATRKLLRTIPAHDRPLSSLEFSANDGLLYTAGADKTLKVWDVATGVLKTTLDHPRIRGIGALLAAPNGRTLIAAGYRLETWNLAKNRIRHTMPTHKGMIHALAISNDGIRFATTGIDRTVRVWLTETLRSLRVSPAFPDTIRALAFSPDGKRLVCGGGDRVVRVLDSATLAEVAQFRGHADAITGVAILPDGDTVTAIDQFGHVLKWSLVREARESVLRVFRHSSSRSPSRRNVPGSPSVSATGSACWM